MSVPEIVNEIGDSSVPVWSAIVASVGGSFTGTTYTGVVRVALGTPASSVTTYSTVRCNGDGLSPRVANVTCRAAAITASTVALLLNVTTSEFNPAAGA